MKIDKIHAELAKSGYVPVFHPSNGEVQTTQCPQRGGGTAPGDDLVGRTLHGSQWSVLSRT